MELIANNTIALSCEELMEINGGGWLKDAAVIAGGMAAMALHDAIDYARGLWDEL